MACLGMTGMAVTVAIWLRVVHWLTVAWVWWPRSPLWAFLSLGFLSIVCSCLPGFVSPELRVSRASCLPAFVSPCYLVPDCGSKVDAIRGTHGLLGGECGGRDLVVWLVC